MNISNSLTALIADIDNTFTREVKNRAEWVDIHLDRSRLFAEARAKFTDNISFGDWRGRSGSAAITSMDAHTCAAYVGMGADLETAKDVLVNTKRSSIRLIYEHEFKGRSGIPHVRNTPKAHKPRPPTENDERDEQIGALYNQGLGRKEIKKLMPDVTGGMLDNVIKKHRVAEEAREQGQLEGAPLSATAEQKLEAHKRRLEKEFEYRVREEVIKRSEAAEARIRARWDERAGKLETAWQRRGRVFSKAEFNLIIRIVHPDTGPHVSNDDRNKAMHLLNERKIKLLDEETFPVARNLRGPPMPRTREELDALKAQVKAENAAKRAAAKAARTNGANP